MRWERSRASENVEDRRGRGNGGLRLGGKGIGLGTIAIALVAMLLGVDPGIVLNMVGGPAMEQQTSAPAQPSADDEASRFVAHVLGDTEDTWRKIFDQSGRQYQDPKLVLFTGSTQTACGQGQAAMGPFYCPADHKVYIDLAFNEDLKHRFKAPGDFAQAYVIAHEVGHHVQNLLGTAEKIHVLRQRVSEKEANALSVRMELQADCFAGVWAHHAQAARQILESGDVEEAINAATAIGDDRLQKQAQGYAVPDSFTHGSSAQRVRWFRKGIESGDPQVCNSFQARNL
ncbi:MAG: neutral zinc metallopeptidase [Thiobacillus sp.]|nr:neutral zinc metallopeptidase [Thiobacillus sp.]